MYYRYPSNAKYPIISAVFCLSFFFLVASAMSQANMASEVDSLRKVYDQNLESIEKESAEKDITLPDSYLKELEALQKNLQKNGDLEGWQAVAGEVARFKDGLKIPQDKIAASPASLSALQKKYQELLLGTENDKSRKIVSLTEKYVGRLTGIQKNLTIVGKIDDAILVNNEIKRVKALPKVTAAEFAVMALDADKKDQDKPGKAAAAKDQEKPGGPLPDGDARPAKGALAPDVIVKGGVSAPEGVKIYQGQNPPPVQGITFKSLPLSGTERMRVSKKVAAAVMVGKKTDTKTTVSTSSSYSHHQRTGSSLCYIRVTVKPSNVSYVLENTKLVVQSFAKDLSGRSGGAELKMDVVKLPKMEGGAQVCVECQPVVTSVSSIRSRGYYASDSMAVSNSGQEFYGIIVSVFDDSGALIYQGASNDSLEKMGIAEVPKEKVGAPADVRERFEAARDAYFRARDAVANSPRSEVLRDNLATTSNEYVIAREAYYESRERGQPPALRRRVE
jgi:hypothetical protein